MKTYLLFSIYHYYPSGGLDDLAEAFSAESDEEAIENATKICQEKGIIGDEYQLCVVGEGSITRLNFDFKRTDE